MDAYEPQPVEQKWQQWWHEHRTFEVPSGGTPGKPKFYCLTMFP